MPFEHRTFGNHGLFHTLSLQMQATSRIFLPFVVLSPLVYALGHLIYVSERVFMSTAPTTHIPQL